MTRSRWVATGLLVLAFALGGLAGGAATMMADRKSHGRRDPYSPQAYAQRLATDLSLDAAQREAVAGVILRHQPVMDSIWAQVREQFNAERQAMRQDIRAILNPEQLDRYNAMVARFDSLRHARAKHRERR
jgi:uncharacterized membrane protein